MAKYTNSYLLADLHMKGGMYEFLEECLELRLSNMEIAKILHDKGFETTDETVRSWLRLWLDAA